MTRQRRSSITQEAAEWLLELRSAGSARRAEFYDWVRQSPEHVREFLAVTGLSRRLQTVDPERLMDVAALADAAEAADVVPFPLTPDMKTESTRRPSNQRLRAGLLAAAAALAVVAVGTLWWFQSGPEVYVTRVGEQRSFNLSDGSLIELNTASRAEVRYSKTARQVDLISGEALFTVHADTLRPFRVQVGSMSVVAVGTQFNVYRRSEDVATVSVLEGTVRIEKAAEADRAAAGGGPAEPGQPPMDDKAFLLNAGEQTSLAKAATGAKERTVDVEDVLAWRQRQLVFRSMPLRKVAAEFNRYNRRHIRLDDSALNDRLITGTFAADRPGSLMLFLAKDAGVELIEDEDGWSVRSARADEAAAVSR